MSNPSPTFLTPTPLLISSSPTRSCTRVSTPKCVAGPSQHPLQSLLSVLNPFQTRPAPPSTHSVPENETLERTDGLAERLHARDDSDGLKQRLAARRNRVTVTHSKPEETRALPSPQKRRRNPSKRSSAYGIPELRAYALVEEAVRRKGRPEDGDISSLIPYDLQRELFDELIAGKNDVQEEEDNDDDGWVRGAWRAAGDAFRFVRGEQKGETKSRREEERGKVPAVAVAAMAHDVISDGDDGTSAAAAYAAAAAIATNATVKEVDERELRGLRQAVTAARAVANVEDANVFVATVGVGSLVAAARLLPGRERAAALTALANIAIMLPKYRTQMLRVDHGRLGDVLKEVVSVSSRFKVQTGGIWHTEALVSGTHLLGSLTLARGAGAEFRRNVATDVELVRRLQRIAGGLKNGEPEGAARAARRALGILGVNTWRPRMPGQKGLRILCIDGGGTRAIMAFEAVC